MRQKRDRKLDVGLYILAALSNHKVKHKDCKCWNEIMEEALY